VSFRYDINLMREETDRQQQERAVARVLIASLLLLAVLLIVTYAIYLARERQINNDVQSIRRVLDSTAAAGLSADDVTRSRRRSKDLQDSISEAAEVVRGCVAWSAVLASLAECCGSDDLGLRKVTARMREEQPFVVVEGLCTAQNPVLRIHSFMQVVANHKAFGPASLLSITRKEGEPVIFEAEVPLRRADVLQTQPREG